MVPFLGGSKSYSVVSQCKHHTIVTKWEDASCDFYLVPQMFHETEHYFMHFCHPHVYLLQYSL